MNNYDPTKPWLNIIEEQSRRTWNTHYVIVYSDGTFNKRFSLVNFEIDHTDGIGTKGRLHWENRTFRNAVLDALAMNLNDLCMSRAKPYKLQNHIFLPCDDKNAVEQIITCLADECCSREIAITGGECAVDDTKSLEISITMSGFMGQKYSNFFHKNDLLVGLASTGFHSNGFSLVKNLVREFGTDRLPFHPDWLTPTRIYNLPVSPFAIRGLQHITGGAFTKIKKRLDGVDAIIHNRHNLEPHQMFKNVYRCIYDDEVMYKTFNCGIGMVLSVNPRNVSEVLDQVGGEVIGEVNSGHGNVIIDSMFSDRKIVL